LVPNALNAQSAPRWLIGGEDDVESQLGRFRDVVALPRRFVVLEGDAPFLKVFSYDGKLIQSLGRAGGGPGEFRTPSALTLDSHRGRLLVVDAANARVTVFTIGDTLAAPRYLALEDIGIQSICVLGDRLFGLARNAPTLLRELKEEPTRLTVIASFGEPRTDHRFGTHPFVRSYASNGPLACDAGSNHIIVASSVLGEVHVLDAETRAQTTARIPGFDRLTITVDDKSMTMAPPDGGFDATLAFVHLDDALYVVAERSDAGSGGPPASLGFKTASIGPKGPGPLSALRRWRPLAQVAGGTLCAVSDPAPTIGFFSNSACR